MSAMSEVYVERDGNMRRGLAKREQNLNDLLFDNNVLFEASVSTKNACGLKCVDAEGCVASTLIYSSATCRGYSSVPASGSPSVHSPGAITLSYLPELSVGSDCSGNQDKCVAAAQCVNDVCSCAKADLQTDYLAYAGGAISGNQVHELRDTTVAQCQSACNNYNDCRSVELHTNGWCQILLITPLDVPNDWDANYGTTTFYQRTCA
ncbi:hypothetical protein BaRGS_00008845 [Batillaria attramentaria]|uniref:Apple domain-containing protein n=1 Tax=Batillaria attramentaria TaxID=370345 RepID=A0ABD0LKB6_9CAEN